MNFRSTSVAALAALSVWTATAACAAPSVWDAWPEHSRVLAEAIVARYGTPDVVEASRLSWSGRRPWVALIVYRDAVDSDRPNGLQQSVSYEVPVRKWRALAAFDRGVEYDPVKRELVARSDSESTNLLALNLADEMIRGRRTAADARDFYDKTLSLAYSGKSSSYTRRLHFVPAWTDMKSK